MKSRNVLRLATLTILLAAPLLADDPPWVARSRLGMVASDSAEASRAGVRILTLDGNAFDAAIATSLALAVARPYSTGLGGGGFMIAYHAKENRIVALDFREMAPTEATAEYYARLQAIAGAGPPVSVYGGNAVAVPGQLAGLEEMRKRFGTKAWSELTRPAIELAQTGVVVDKHFRDACLDAIDAYDRWPELQRRCRRLFLTLLRDGRAPEIGDKIDRPDLLKALHMVSERGSAAFYNGPLGEATVRAVNEAGGEMLRRDLVDYHVRERQPLRISHHGHDIIMMPPPSSGGVCLAETLNILDICRFRSDLHPVDDQEHMLIEALKHAFADRAGWLGDADFAPVPTDRLTSIAYATTLAQRIQLGNTLPPQRYGTGCDASAPRDSGTSHFCVADRHGNVVAVTETINGTFGSFVVAEPFGIILNNQMDDFATEPGKPNIYGLVHGEFNAVAPRKRPLSSMSPTLVLKDGRPVLVLGASGGPRIITSVLQVMRNVIEREMSLADAISALRIHHQWVPNEVYFDQDPPEELVERLEARGHKVSNKRKVGVVQAIQFLPGGTMVGASDPRKGGRPAGMD